MIIDIKDGSGWRERSSVNEDGQYHGKHFSWHIDGNRWYEIDHVNGEYHGKYISWYNNGNKWEEIDFVNGERHGKYFLWYRNGNKCVEIDYVDGKVWSSSKMAKNNK